MDMDVDVVPVRELRGDDGAADRVVRHQILDRLVRKDNAPAERVVGAVALEYMNLMRRLAQIHQEREITTGRAPNAAGDTHERPCRLARGPRNRNSNCQRRSWGTRIEAE